MKYTDVEYCNHLIKEIDKHKQEIKNFDNLLKRINEITTVYTKEIKIQISEGYTNTPVTFVSLENFIKFIKEEQKVKEKEKDYWELELFNFYPDKEEK